MQLSDETIYLFLARPVVHVHIAVSLVLKILKSHDERNPDATLQTTKLRDKFGQCHVMHTYVELMISQWDTK